MDNSDDAPVFWQTVRAAGEFGVVAVLEIGLPSSVGYRPT